MKKVLVVAIMILAASAVGVAQVPAPDCFFTINNFTAAGDTANFDNRFLGCDTWTLIYQSSGFAALSLTFQSATGATVATMSAFGTYTGTVVTGVNPNTNTTGRVSQFSNGLVITPWLRVDIGGLMGSGTINGVVYGYKTGYTSGNGGGGGAACPGTAGTPCVVDLQKVGAVAVVTGGVAGSQGVGGLAGNGVALAGNPNLMGISDGTNARNANSASTVGDANTATGIQAHAPSLFNGATWDRQLVCPSTVIVDDSASGNTQIIAASGSTKVRICKMTFTTAAGVSIQLTQGTGANCAVGTANLSGLYQTVSSVAEDFIADQSTLTSAASQAVCLNLGATTRTTGIVQFVQF